MASYEQERRWLAALGESAGPFFLIGLEPLEQRYLLERARERLRAIGQELDLTTLVHASSRLELAQLSCLQLFETQGWRVIEGLESLKTVAPLLPLLGQAQLRLIGLSSQPLAPEWLQLQPTPICFDLSKEKAWDRPKRLATWLQALARSLGLQLPFPQAQQLCEQFECDRQMLKTHVEAVAAAQNYQGAWIDPQQRVAASAWRLLEEIWSSQRASALARLESLLEQEPSAIPLAALLRQQWHALISILEGASATPSRRRLADRIGYFNLRQGAFDIAKAQWDLKSSRDPRETMQTLIVRLCAVTGH